MSIFRSLRRSRPDAAARALYTEVVAQARSPAFFIDYRIPDTLDGRFEMIVLHAHLVFRRLASSPADTAASALSQELFDLMFADMDQSLREMGVGDLSVGKRVRAMIEAFYGRAAAYDAGLAADTPALASALRRNLYGTVPADNGTLDAALSAMAVYVLKAEEHLARQPIESFLRGGVSFPAPAELDDAG